MAARAGTRATIKVRSDQTRGAYSLVEWEHHPSTPGPPLHTHEREEEAFYVLKGTLIVTVGDEHSEEGPGAFIMVPRRTPHTFSVISEEPATILLILSPPGYEGFWEELSKATDGGATQASAETMSALGAKYAMRVLPEA